MIPRVTPDSGMPCLPNPALPKTLLYDTWFPLWPMTFLLVLKSVSTKRPNRGPQVQNRFFLWLTMIPCWHGLVLHSDLFNLPVGNRQVFSPIQDFKNKTLWTQRFHPISLQLHSHIISVISTYNALKIKKETELPSNFSMLCPGVTSYHYERNCDVTSSPVLYIKILNRR